MKKIEIEHGSITWNITENTFVHTINEWSQFFGNYNWITFTAFELTFKNDISLPGFEVEFIVLGLGLRFRNNRSWEGTEIQETLDDLKKNPPKN